MTTHLAHPNVNRATTGCPDCDAAVQGDRLARAEAVVEAADGIFIDERAVALMTLRERLDRYHAALAAHDTEAGS